MAGRRRESRAQTSSRGGEEKWWRGGIAAGTHHLRISGFDSEVSGESHLESGGGKAHLAAIAPKPPQGGKAAKRESKGHPKG